jgi:NADH:ubiquinone oxidoreductase subunit H
MVVCGFIGFRLLAWHRVNRNHWKDSRRREGAVLSVLLGFAPAVTAAVAFLVWGGELGTSGASILGGVIGFLTLMLKTLFFCWLFIWVRWTLPRFRYDQLMSLGWKVLVPIGLVNILLTGVLIKMGVW